METFPPDVLRVVLAQAGRAPSVHNTQPWHWRQTRRGVDLYVDQRRQLMHADRNGRDMVISCGAALHGLVVAAAAEGWAATVDRLPDPQAPMLIARVLFSRKPGTVHDQKLAEAATRRRTDRRAPASWPVPQDRVDRLTRVAALHGTLLTTLGGTHGRQLSRTLVTTAMRIQHLNESYLDELFTWARAEQLGVGIPVTQQLTRETVARLHDAPSRFPSGVLDDAPARRTSEEPQDSWLVLSTSSDDRLSWLRTGEALLAIWLDCVAGGLSLVPFSQPIEVEQTRITLQDGALRGASCPQLMLRVGWPSALSEPVRLTPRLDVDEVLTTTASAQATARG